MMKYIFFVATLFFSSTAYSADFSVEGFEIVSSKRVNIKEYVIEYRVKLKNNGVDIAGLNTTISSEGNSVSLVDDSLSFDAIASDETVESTDTFSVKVDRTTKFEPSSLIFDFKES